jgi:hypothetical protein
MSTQIISFDLAPFYIQSGYGIPNHYSTVGSEYTDLNTVIKYVNQNGLNYWVEMGQSGGAGGSFTGAIYSTGTTIFTNNTGGTFSVTGYTYIPHLEYNNSNSTIWNNGFGNISSNISFGQNAMVSTTSGTFNTAFGNESLSANTTGNYNTGIGAGSLTYNTIGVQNFGIGSYALYYNTTGSYNTAIGVASLQNNTTAQRNVGIGTFTLYNNIGSRNIGIGFYAGSATKGSDNTLIGSDSNNTNAGLVSGSNNTIIGTLLSGVINGSNNTIFGKPSGLSSATTNNIIIADGSGNIRFRDNNINTILPRLAGSGDRMVIVSPNGELSARTITNTTFTGGTVSGSTSFTSGLTVNYIDFDTTPTVPNPTGGTVYFDSTENALSYKPLTNQNDVTVNLGQESLIRVYNNLGYQINNGQVLHITGSTSGVPTVALANASKLATITTIGLAQTSGVATHDIPNGQYGFMTNFGVVRDLNTSAFTAGDEIYLSDTVDGALTNNPDNIALTSRVSTVGFCLESSPTIGKILVVISNENKVESLTQKEVNVLLGNTISTGVFNFTGITLASSNTFNVAPVDAWFVDNTTNPLIPEVLYVNYSGQTNIPSLYYNTATETYLLLTSAGTITQQTTFPTPQQRRQNVYLGKMGHGNRTSLINAFNEPDLDVSPLSQLRDMFTPIKLINENVYPSPNSNLTFNTSSGTLFGLGIGFTTNQFNPSSISVSGNSPTTFQYRTQTGGTATNRTTIDPANYDLNGVITTIGSPAKQATNQRIFLLQNGQFRIQYGQTKYADLTTAIAAVNTEAFTTFSNFRDNAVLIAILSVRSDATILNDIAQAKITFASKFGETVGGTGGISTTTLQQAYNNSATPEIVTNSVEGALSIKNGTGNADNVTNLFEGLNAAGNATSFIRADGNISGTTVQTNVIYDNGTKVGIGTIMPTSKLHSVASLSGPLSYDSLSAIFGYNTSTDTVYNNQVGVAGRVQTSGGKAIYGDASFGAGWGGYFDGKGYFSANVGIGTTTPVSKLHVIGDTRLQGGLTANTISATTTINSGTKTTTTIDGSNDQSGIVVVGSNTVGGSGYNDFIKVTNTAAGATNINKTFRVNNTGGLEIVNSAYSNIAFSLTDAGVLSTPGGGTSDLRTKKNIEYIYDEKTTLIKKLKPVKFEFKNNENIKRHGFIAQDILELYPELVLGNGNEENGVYGLDYDGILSLTVKALQESIIRIEKLESVIKELKNNNN